MISTDAGTLRRAAWPLGRFQDLNSMTWANATEAKSKAAQYKEMVQNGRRVNVDVLIFSPIDDSDLVLRAWDSIVFCRVALHK